MTKYIIYNAKTCRIKLCYGHIVWGRFGIGLKMYYALEWPI